MCTDHNPSGEVAMVLPEVEGGNEYIHIQTKESLKSI
jgi:hypothetical protein